MNLPHAAVNAEFRRRPWVLPALLVALAIGLPASNALLPPSHPVHLSLFSVNLVGQIVCFALLALALDFVWGLAGILSLGHGVFFGIGGYVMGFHLLNGAYADTQVLPDFMLFMGWKEFPAALRIFDSLPVAVILGLGLAVVVAGVFGFATFRSRINGVYFSIITQALTYALMLLLFNNDLGLGGNNGLTGFTVLAGQRLADVSTQVALASASCLALAGAYLLLRQIADSSLGHTLVAVRDDEARLRFLGFRTDRIKLFAWCLSAAVAALAGMLYVPQVGIINPTIVSPLLSVEIAVWVAIGGRGTLVGAVIGAVLVNGLKFWLSAELPSVWPFILAGITLLITVALGNGLWSGATSLFRARRSAA
jgi:urea transport system permease protein